MNSADRPTPEGLARDATEITLEEIRALKNRSQATFAARCARIVWNLLRHRGLTRPYPRGLESLLCLVEQLVTLDRVFEYQREDLRAALNPFEASSLPVAWALCAAANAALSEPEKKEVTPGLAHKAYVYARQAATTDEHDFQTAARTELAGLLEFDRKKQRDP
jgi:hypothetical protein